MHLRICALLCAVLASTAAPAAETVPVRTIYLVRHGAYVPSRDADARGPGLSALGIAQARLTASRLRALPTPIATITSSTMTRARETAAVIHELIATATPSASPAISECTPPAAFALNENEAALSACKARLDAAFGELFRPARGAHQHDVLVAHGNVIRYFVMKALGTDTRMWTNMSVGHASVTIVEVHANGALRVIAVGDIGHIPANMQSWGDDADPNLLTPDARKF
jgi:serine/threonine-protein phosphatase PGAM5